MSRYSILNNETGEIEQNIDWLDQVYDGNHTMNDLYRERAFLFSIICNAYKDKAHLTFQHAEGDKKMPEGKFFVWIDTPKGMYGYHYHLEELYLFRDIKREPFDKYDGFTTKDSKRLLSLKEGN